MRLTHPPISYCCCHLPHAAVCLLAALRRFCCSDQMSQVAAGLDGCEGGANPSAAAAAIGISGGELSDMASRQLRSSSLSRVELRLARRSCC